MALGFAKIDAGSVSSTSGVQAPAHIVSEAPVGNNTERGGESILSSQIFLFQIQMIYVTSVN